MLQGDIEGPYGSSAQVLQLILPVMGYGGSEKITHLYGFNGDLALTQAYATIKKTCSENTGLNLPALAKIICSPT